jgi:hypothetical protein
MPHEVEVISSNPLLFLCEYVKKIKKKSMRVLLPKGTARSLNKNGIIIRNPSKLYVVFNVAH